MYKCIKGFSLEKCDDDVFMISTTKTKRMLSVERINVEIVEG
jgi:hypothetical protein